MKDPHASLSGDGSQDAASIPRPSSVTPVENSIASLHLDSWARICSGNHESAGKRYSSSTGRGNNWLRTSLVECSWSVTRDKNTYLCEQFRRISRRRGPKKAAFAVAHSILAAVYYILRDRVLY